MKFELIAPCYFGTESTAAFEVRRLGAENVQVTDGRIAFSGDESMIAAANLNLRCAERVLILLKRFSANTFDEAARRRRLPGEGVQPVQHPVQRARLPEHREKSGGGAAEKGPQDPLPARDRRAV